MSVPANIINVGPFGRWDEPKAIRVKMTPELAAACLDRNVFNRVKSASTIADYAWQMANGHWLYNGEPIIFDWFGNLLDGQHRLEAVVKSGATVETLVAVGVDPATFKTIDQGRLRTRNQVREMVERGRDIKSANVSTTAAVGLIVYQYEQGVRAFYNRNYKPYSTAELMDFIDRREGLVESANYGQRKAHNRGKSGIRMYPKALGALHYLFGRRDEWMRDYFFNALETGAGLDATDPIFVAREKLGRHWDCRRNVAIDSQLMMQFCVRGWNAYREGKTLKSMRPDMESIRGQSPVPAAIPDII